MTHCLVCIHSCGRAAVFYVGDDTHSHVQRDDLYGWALVSFVRLVRWDELYVFTLVVGLQYAMGDETHSRVRYDDLYGWALVSLVRYVRRVDLWFVGGCSISSETRLMNMCDIMTCRALVSLVRLVRRADLWFVGGCSISCETRRVHMCDMMTCMVGL